MTKIINWKKQRIEKFKKEHINNNEDSNDSCSKQSYSKEVEASKEYERKIEEQIVYRRVFNESRNQFHYNQTSLGFDRISSSEPVSSSVWEKHFISNTLNQPDLHISSSDGRKFVRLSNTNLVPLSNPISRSYHEPEQEGWKNGLEELRKLPQLREIEISTVSSSDLPQEHTRALTPEYVRDHFSHSSRSSHAPPQNQIHSHISSSCTFASKTKIQDAAAIQEIHDSNLVSTVQTLPAADNGSTRAMLKQNSTNKGKRHTSDRAPRKRKPLLDGQSKELLDKAGVQEKYYLECLYGENIDKFRELVTLVAVQNKESEDNVKSILSNNRRRVKNRGSARRSRVSKNDHLQNLREQLVKRRKHLARVLHYIKRNQKLRDKIAKLRALKQNKSATITKSTSHNEYPNYPPIETIPSQP